MIYLISISALGFLISLYHLNWWGFWWSILLCLMIIILQFYNNNKSIKLFYLVINVCTLMSLFVAVIGFFDFLAIAYLKDFHNIFIVGDLPNERISSIFLNPNYYAAVIEVIIIMCLYKLIILKRYKYSKFFYLTVIIINIFMLYFTGSRTAWLALFIAIPIMFIANRNYKRTIYIIFFEIGILFLAVYQYNFFPRMETLSFSISERLLIWSASFKGFLVNPLLGQGPYTYHLIFKEFHAPPTVHAHSIYIDTILCYGLIGFSILIKFLIEYGKKIKKSFDYKSMPLVVGVSVLLLVHGLFDVVIYNPQVFMLIFIPVFSLVDESTML